MIKLTDILRESQRMQRGFEKLEKILLDIGGESVLYTYEEDLDKLIRDGREMYPDIYALDMEQGQCHVNTAAAYEYAKDKGLEFGFAPESYKIATGWALKDDQWVQHSWLYDVNNNLAVETTSIIRDIYYGIVLDEDAADKFCLDNV